MLLLDLPRLVDSPGRVPTYLDRLEGYGAEETAEELYVPITVAVLTPAPMMELSKKVVPEVSWCEEEED